MNQDRDQIDLYLLIKDLITTTIPSNIFSYSDTVPSTAVVRTHIHKAGITCTNTIWAVFLGELDFALDGPGAEALMVRVVAGEVAVFPDAEFGVRAGVGYAFVLAHFSWLYVELLV